MHRLLFIALPALCALSAAAREALPHRVVKLETPQPSLLINPPASLLPAHADTSRFVAEWTLRPDGRNTLLSIAMLSPNTQADVNYCSALMGRWLAESRQYYDFLRASWFTDSLVTLDFPAPLPDGTWVSPRRSVYHFENGVLRATTVRPDSLGSLPGVRKASHPTPAELARAEMAALADAVNRDFARYDSHRTDSALTLLLFGRGGRLDARPADATPARLSDDDVLAFQQLRASLSLLPADALTAVFTESGAPYGGRVVRAVLNNGQWTFADALQPEFATLAPAGHGLAGWSIALLVVAIVAAVVGALMLWRRKRAQAHAAQRPA